MAYVTGTASSYADLLTAIQSALTANGWTLTSGVLSKSGCHILLRNVSSIFAAGPVPGLVASIGNASSGGALTSNPSTQGVRLGPFGAPPSPGDLSFPCVYNIHINTNPDEVYIYVNYNTDMYQYLAWGQNPVVGMTGTGNWLSGTFGNIATGNQPYYNNPITTSSAFTIYNVGPAGSSGGSTAAGLFYLNYGAASLGDSAANTIMHTNTATSGMDGWSSFNGIDTPNAYYAISELMKASPNAWNNQSILVNLTISLPASSNKRVIVGELEHSRYIKINYITPGDIITLGSDKWKIYPNFRKGTAELNGSGSNTGYYGLAVRYDGP